MANKAEKIKTGKVLFWIIGIFLVIYVLCWLIPFVWGIFTSLKDDMELRNNYFGLPQKWLFTNYVTALSKMSVTVISVSGQRIYYIEDMFLNGFLYAFGRAVCASVVPCVTAYLTTKYRYKFNRVVDVAVLIFLSLPIVGATPSMLQVTRSLGLYNSMLGMWVLQLTTLNMYYFVFKAASAGISDSLLEAAKIDGANNYQVLFKIVLPLLRGTLFTIILIMFVSYWNDYQNPMLYMPGKPTIAYGLYYFNFNTDNELSSISMKLCGSFIVMTPIIIVFCIFSNRLMKNISLGGVKE